MKRRDTFWLIPLSMEGLGSLIREASAATGQHLYRHHRENHEPCAFEYINTVIDMLRWIRKTQSENILEAAYAVARTIENGGNCWSFWDQGHTHKADIFPDRNGDPGLIVAGYDPEKSKKGDCFLVSYPLIGHEYEELFADVVKKKIFVIGGASPVLGDCRKAEDNRQELQNIRFRPFSNIWIDTPITSTGAVVNIPGSPAPLGPVSGPIYLTLWWMICADACRILARTGKKFPVKGDETILSGDRVPWVNLDSPLMDDYFDTVLMQLELIGAELGDMRTMAELAVDSLLSGGSVYFYSRYPESLASEATNRRGGFCFGKRIADGRIDGSSGDTVIMGITKPDDERDMANIEEFRKRGMKIASIGPLTRNVAIPDGKTVPGEADIHVGRMSDTCGLFAIPGFDRKVCPTSGLVNIAILWSMSVEIASQLIERTGNTPGIFFSGALKWGRTYGNQMREIVRKRGY